MNRSIEKRIAAYVAARGKVTAKQGAVGVLNAKLAGIVERTEAKKNERSHLIAASDAAVAQRIVDGDDNALPDPTSEAKMRELDSQIPAFTVAAAKVRAQIAEAEAAVPPLMPAVSEAALYLVSEVQGDGLDQLKAVIAQLVPPVVQLLAGDHIRAATVGSNGYPVPNGAPVSSNGAMLLAGLLKAIPKNLRPDEMDDERLAEAARAISQPIIAKLKG